MSRKFLSGGLLASLLLALAACGGPGLKPPDPPDLVVVTPGPDVLHVSWVHSGQRAKAFIVYREPRDNPAARVKLASVPKNDGDGVAFSYMDTTASDESKVLYSVAAMGPGGASKATVQTDNPPPGLAVSLKKCQIHKPTATDSDGDGLSNTQERTGWTFTLFEGTATRNGISGKYQQDSKSYTVKSNPNNPDTDGDGLCDLQEMMHRTDPTTADSDEDGLTDLAEIDTWGSAPNNVDTDLDSFNPIIKVQSNKETIDDFQSANGNPDLFDGSEVQTYHTSPTLFDSDGDTYSDYNEIEVRGSKFNPLVANLPSIELSLTGQPYLAVNIAYSNSSKKAQTKTASLQKGTSSSKTDTSSTTWREWAKVSSTVSTKAKGGLIGASVSSSASITVAGGFSHVHNTGWSKTSTQDSQNTYSDATATAREQGRTIAGGEIGIALNVHNPSNVGYILTNMTVTALQRDPDDPTTFRPVGTLLFSKDAFGNKGFTMGPGDTKGPLDATYQTEAGNVILDLMANPSSLLFTVGSFTLSNEQGVSYAFMQETTYARTAFLTIDYGNGDVVRAHVASNVQRKHGKIVGVTLKDALGILGIKYKTAKITDEDGKTYTVLTQLYDNAAQAWVAVDQANRKFWTSVVSGGKTAPVTQNFDDITLQAGGDAFLLYVQDQDGDSLFLRDESLVGTSDQNPDSDGDGLTDYFEAKTGWEVNPPENLPPLYPAHVYPNPTLADADNDGYNDSQEKVRDTDPNNPDTDGDGLCDGSGSAVNTSGPCTSGATPDPKPLVPRFTFLPDDVNTVPKPYNFTTKPSADTISTDFSLPVKATSTFKVRSNIRGPMLGTFSFSNGGRTITFTPKNNEWWLPGEKMMVSLDNITAEATGKKLPVYQYSFRAATNKAGADVPDQLDLYVGNDQSLDNSTGIVAGDFNRDGLADIAYISNPGNTGQPARAVVRFQAAYDWSALRAYSLGAPYARGIVTGDFNNDGKLDLAAALPTANKVAVLLASATVGEFDQAKLYDTGADPIGIATADFNGDGNLDLVTANLHWNSTVLLGNGDGSFGGYQPIPSAEKGSQDVAVADVNGDGFVDILTAFDDGSEKGVFTNLGNGDGTFRQTGKTQPFPASGTPVALATGDFNGDGWPDVVTANASNDVSLLINSAKGDGLFPQTFNESLPEGGAPQDIMTADFNGDGLLDIAFANNTNIPLGVLLGTANLGTFDTYTIGNDTGFSPQVTLKGFSLTALLFNYPPGANNNPLTLLVAGSSDQSGYPIGQVSFPAP